MKRLLFVLVAGMMVASLAIANPGSEATTTAATGGAVGAGTKTTGFKVWPTLSEYTKETGKKISKFTAPPEFANFPVPLKDRLPEEPAVVQPTQEIGQYGGTWHMMRTRPEEIWVFFRYWIDEPLVRFSGDFQQILPNVAQSYQWSNDYKTITFKLRKGMKWSDGVPVTADDFVFTIDKIYKYKPLTPVPPSTLMAGGEVLTVKKIDDLTFSYNFKAPFGAFLEQLAGQWPVRMYYCAHYLQKFHPDYVAQADLEKMWKAEGFNTWVDWFNYKMKYYEDPDHPVLTAWKLIDKKESQVQRCVRNPYYWKVDTNGNVLPYIDKVEYPLIESADALRLKAINGEISCDYRYIQGNYALFKQNESNGKYRIIPQIFGGGQYGGVSFNFTSPDKELRKIFDDIRFRRAVSLSINRTEVNGLVYNGQAFISQLGVANDSIWYDEKLAKQYTEYDPAAANQLLDEMGLKWDAKHEYRTKLDGSELKMVIVYGFEAQAGDTVADIVNRYATKYFKDIGLNVVAKGYDRSVINQQQSSGNYDLWFGGGTGSGSLGYGPIFSMFDPNELGPIHGAWGLWKASNGTKGEEPPAAVKRYFELGDLAKQTGDYAERNRLIREAIRITAEPLYSIGCMNEAPTERFAIAIPAMTNIPAKIHVDSTIFVPASWYLKQ